MGPVLAGLVSISASTIISAFAQGWGEREGWSRDWELGHMAFGGVMMVVFWGAVSLLVVFLVRGLGWFGQRGGASAGRQSPLEILQERFARGEIDQEEYDERRRILSNNG
jgi:putative membrane protein